MTYLSVLNNCFCFINNHFIFKAIFLWKSKFSTFSQGSLKVFQYNSLNSKKKTKKTRHLFVSCFSFVFSLKISIKIPIVPCPSLHGLLPRPTMEVPFWNFPSLFFNTLFFIRHSPCIYFSLVYFQILEVLSLQ